MEQQEKTYKSKARQRAQVIKEALGETKPQFVEEAIQSGKSRSQFLQGEPVRSIERPYRPVKTGKVWKVITHCIVQIHWDGEDLPSEHFEMTKYLEAI